MTDLPFPTPPQQRKLETVAEEWAAILTYLRATPLEAVNAAFAVFTVACDTAGADYLRTFMDLLKLNPTLPGSHRTIRKEPPHGVIPAPPTSPRSSLRRPTPPHHDTDPHTDGVDTSGK